MEPKCTFTIGRAHDCDIPLDHDSVSRHHAELYLFQNGQWVIKDLGANRFGTYIVDGNQMGTDQDAVYQERSVLSEERIFATSTALRFADYTITVRELLERACYTSFPSLPASTQSCPRPPTLWGLIVSRYLTHAGWIGVGAIAAVIAAIAAVIA